jgi:hypothetical protein
MIGVLTPTISCMQHDALSLYAPECVERLSGKSYARANRLTIRRLIAA